MHAQRANEVLRALVPARESRGHELVRAAVEGVEQPVGVHIGVGGAIGFGVGIGAVAPAALICAVGRAGKVATDVRGGGAGEK